MDSLDHKPSEEGCNSPYFPVLTTFAKAEHRARTLKALAELSFVAGRCGDAFGDFTGDMFDAVGEAFPNLDRDRRQRLCVGLCDAFKAGEKQRTIDQADRPAEALRFARGLAVCHEFRCEHEYDGERSPNSHRWAAAAWSYKLARYLPISAAEAAACALEALNEKSYRPTMTAGDDALASGERGVEERLAAESYAQADEADDDELLASILGEGGVE